MGHSSNTVGLDTTSQAIARGEVGANYSRYSTGNLAALARGMGAANSGLPSSVSRMSMMSVPRNNSSDETPIEMDALSSGLGSPAALPAGRSRFSEYGLDGSSSESPSLRDSTLYDNRRESIGGYYGNNKSMEDTSLLWNEKNIEADESVGHLFVILYRLLKRVLFAYFQLLARPENTTDCKERPVVELSDIRSRYPQCRRHLHPARRLPGSFHGMANPYLYV